jgi:carboxymethylenebutenolidase
MGDKAINTEWINLPVSDGSEMRVYNATAAEPNGFGLIVFQEAFGVNPHIRDVTERFAKEGFFAAAPELFHRTGPGFEGSYSDFAAVQPHYSALTDEGLAADITATFQHLEGKTKKVACVGYCLGGKASYLAASTAPLACAVSYYGGGIAPNERSKGLLGRTPEIKCPILLFWGGKDQHIGADARSAVEQALVKAEKDYTQVVFSKADHGFNCDARPSYHAEASNEALALVHAFFATHLGY